MMTRPRQRYSQVTHNSEFTKYRYFRAYFLTQEYGHRFIPPQSAALSGTGFSEGTQTILSLSTCRGLRVVNHSRSFRFNDTESEPASCGARQWPTMMN
jgi:hypothetical protein